MLDGADPVVTESKIVTSYDKDLLTLGKLEDIVKQLKADIRAVFPD